MKKYQSAARKLYRLLFPFLNCCACGQKADCDDDCLCSRCAEKLSRLKTESFLRGGHEVWYTAPYEDIYAQLVRRMKFQRDREAARVIGDRCAAAYQNIGRMYDLLVPVPLSRKRRWERGYNQCDLTAARIAKQCGVTVERRALKHIRDGRPQHQLGWLERFENADHAYQALEKMVKGKTVLILDDVFTSGATSDDCVRALCEAGAAYADVLCFARTLPGEQTAPENDPV